MWTPVCRQKLHHGPFTGTANPIPDRSGFSRRRGKPDGLLKRIRQISTNTNFEMLPSIHLAEDSIGKHSSGVDYQKTESQLYPSPPVRAQPKFHGKSRRNNSNTLYGPEETNLLHKRWYCIHQCHGRYLLAGADLHYFNAVDRISRRFLCYYNWVKDRPAFRGK